MPRKETTTKPAAEAEVKPKRSRAAAPKRPAQNKQKTQALKRAATPKQAAIEKQKEKFLAELRRNGGNVSRALAVSKLNRNVAYDHFKNDPDFAEKWVDAQEYALDELQTEARRRASSGLVRKKFTKGGDPIIDPATGEQYTELEYSDTLLIYLMKQGESRQKWRGRIIKVGNIALESVKTIGLEHGVPEDVIVKIQEEMTERFKQIQLV